MKKKMATIFALVIGLGLIGTVYAVTILNVLVVNTIGCQEYYDTGLDYLTRGYIDGYFYTGNWSYNGSYWDTCLDNLTLVEGVCGSSIHANYSNLAAAITMDCSNYTSSNGTATTMCYAGACI